MTKKSQKSKKAQRRKKELLKAQAKSSVRTQIAEKIKKEVHKDAATEKKQRFKLDYKRIKRDLIKTVGFVVFVVILLIVLKTQNLQFDFGIYK